MASLKYLMGKMEAAESDIVHSRAMKRIKNWKNKLRRSRMKGFAEAHKWIKGERPPPIGAIRSKAEPKKVYTSMDQIFETLTESWMEIFDQKPTDLMTWESFKSAYSAFIPDASECRCPTLEAKDLRKALQRMKSTRAVAADGFRVRELRDLPDVILKIAAYNCMLHENGMPLTACFCRPMVMCIGKESEDPSREDAECLFAPFADETRPLANLAVILNAWDMARFEQRQEWREKWLHDSMQGARASREVFNVSWELALRLERAKILEIPFSGVSLDR